MPEEFKIELIANYPNEYGGGEVRFSFHVPGSPESTQLDVPFVGREGIDAGVKEAARQLADFADQLAKSARAMAE